MPSSLRTCAEFAASLGEAIAGMRRVVAEYPTDGALGEIAAQLERLEGWTRAGSPPTLEQKGELDFGLLASRYLHDIDGQLAGRIYEIASFVTYWS